MCWIAREIARIFLDVLPAFRSVDRIFGWKPHWARSAAMNDESQIILVENEWIAVGVTTIGPKDADPCRTGWLHFDSSNRCGFQIQRALFIVFMISVWRDQQQFNWTKLWCVWISFRPNTRWTERQSLFLVWVHRPPRLTHWNVTKRRQQTTHNQTECTQNRFVCVARTHQALALSPSLTLSSRWLNIWINH